MIPTVTKVTPIYPSQNFIQWTLDDPNNVLQYFDVLRAGSPAGPYKTVAPQVLEDVYHYTDKSPHNYGLTTKIWYVIRAVPKSGSINATLSEPRSAKASSSGTLQDRIARKARYDLSITLKRLNGVELVILKRKRFGTRCSTCYNPSTKDVLLSHCSECYGTSFTGGYHTGVTVFGRIDPSVVQAAFDRTGDTETAVNGITMLDYPEVEPDDIVVERETNRRFIVKRKIPTEGRRILVHQDLQVSELSRSAVEYTVTI
ncbi:hypothetical protein CMI47_20055 [Candidatus Pacearchaeota archaeon]|nr:hypothetical protein [Candidatus Pacearchaeota archaeon]|tara:strand:+ start:3642 stop:4415 length:774 start_codon:yes stop_codon:yes gene_type:complete